MFNFKQSCINIFQSFIKFFSNPSNSDKVDELVNLIKENAESVTTVMPVIEKDNKYVLQRLEVNQNTIDTMVGALDFIAYRFIKTCINLDSELSTSAISRAQATENLTSIIFKNWKSLNLVYTSTDTVETLKSNIINFEMSIVDEVEIIDGKNHRYFKCIEFTINNRSFVSTDESFIDLFEQIMNADANIE